MAELIELAPPPQAVICTNDIVASEALDTARTCRLRVPDEVYSPGWTDNPQTKPARPRSQLPKSRQPTLRSSG